jgi:hypothetical protein
VLGTLSRSFQVQLIGIGYEARRGNRTDSFFLLAVGGTPSATLNILRSIRRRATQRNRRFDCSPKLRFAESADLSQHRDDGLLQTSGNESDLEDPFSALLTSPTGNTTTLTDAGSLPTVTGRPESTSTVPMPVTSQPACQPLDPPASPHAAPYHNGTFLPEARPSQSTPTLQNTIGQKLRKYRKSTSVRLSAKKDLTAAEIGPVSKVLLMDDALSFFRSHSQSISAA